MKFTSFFCALIFSFSFSAMAQTPFGGTLFNKKTFEKLHLVCLEEAQGAQADKILCQRAKAFLISESEIKESQDFTLYRYEMKTRADNAAKRRKNILKETYLGIGFAGTGLTLFGAAFGGASGEEFFHMVAIGAVIDLVKAPVVVASYFTHKFLAKRKVRKAIHHLLGKKERNNYYSIHRNSFKAITQEFFPETK